jgi:hypothetical protein
LPRKATGEKLEKVISTKISSKKYELFEKYAREYYIKNKIKQPTVSLLLRGLINVWLRKMESRNIQTSLDLTQPVEPAYSFDMDRLRQATQCWVVIWTQTTRTRLKISSTTKRIGMGVKAKMDQAPYTK